MPSESEQHRRIKKIISCKLREWFGGSILEYNNEAHRRDVYCVTPNGISIYVEVIWNPSDKHFYDDLIAIQRATEDIIVVIVNPAIMDDKCKKRQYEITLASKRKAGIKMLSMINGRNVLEDNQYVDSEVKDIISNAVEEKRSEVNLRAQSLDGVIDTLELVKNREEQNQKEERHIKINTGVFNPWMNVSIIEDYFHINIPIDENVDPVLLNDAIDFLKSKKENYGIIKLRDKIKCLNIKYNNLENNIEKNINEYLCNSYPSLELKESWEVISQNCIIRNNVNKLINYKLKKSFLNSGKIIWNNIVLEEKTENTLWRLIDPRWTWGIFIQSKDQKDVNKDQFIKAMEDLILNILSDNLKQQNILYREIEWSLKKFKEKLKRLSNELSIV